MKHMLGTAAMAALMAAPVAAEELSVVGSWSSLPLHQQYEAPFWTETLPEASGGEIEVSLTTHGQMNLGVADVFRLLGDGVYDVAMTVADYAVADEPSLEGLARLIRRQRQKRHVEAFKRGFIGHGVIGHGHRHIINAIPQQAEHIGHAKVHLAMGGQRHVDLTARRLWQSFRPERGLILFVQRQARPASHN